MDRKLKNYLDKNKVKYGLGEHRKVYTAYDEAETLASQAKRSGLASSPTSRSGQHMKPKEVAKTVLVKADKALVLVVIPAGKNVDFGKVKKKLKAKKVSMARESDITNKLKSKIGLIHPFGPVYKLDTTLVDNAVLKEKKIRTSAGSYTESVEITPAQFKKLVEPITGSFSKSK